MAEPFSYERDVAPLAGNYFNRLQSSGLRPEAQALLYKNRVASLESGFSKEAEAKAKSVDYERAVLALEDSRKKSLEARASMSALGELQKALDFGLTQVPEEERSVYMARVGVGFGSLIGTNEIAKTQFSAAQKATTTRKSGASEEEKYADKIFEGLSKVKMAKDPLGRPIDQFESEGDDASVTRVITNFGTEEQKAQAADAPASVKWQMALDAQTRRDAAKLQGSKPQTQGPRSLYGKSPTPP
jgi:hypothetical protein